MVLFLRLCTTRMEVQRRLLHRSMAALPLQRMVQVLSQPHLQEAHRQDLWHLHLNEVALMSMPCVMIVAILRRRICLLLAMAQARPNLICESYLVSMLSLLAVS
jgi:hypothetical protein